MAVCVSIVERHRASFIHDLFDLAQEAENNRAKEYFAVLKIQAYFRGYITRLHLKILYEKAVIMQKAFRGWMGRIRFRKVVQEKLNGERNRYYGKKAIIIQKAWRGYYSRRYLHNYYDLKRYLRGLEITNSIVRLEMREAELEALEATMAAEERALEEHQSTQVVGARVNSGLTAKQLRHHSSETSSVKVLTMTPTTEEDIPQFQGPFKSVKKVQQQRRKPLRPTLRVATSYTSEDDAKRMEKMYEWTMRVSDLPFNTSTTISHKYIPSIHPPVETSVISFREEYRPSKTNSSKSDFRTVISPIPLFDDYETRY